MQKKLLIIAAVLAFTASSVLMAGSVEAKRGSPRPNEQNSGPALTFAPDSVSANSDYVVNGTGFAANADLMISTLHSKTPWSKQFHSVVSDANGAFSLTLSSYLSGEIVHEAHQQKGNSRNLDLVASATLVVNP